MNDAIRHQAELGRVLESARKNARSGARRRLENQRKKKEKEKNKQRNMAKLGSEKAASPKELSCWWFLGLWQIETSLFCCIVRIIIVLFLTFLFLKW